MDLWIRSQDKRHLLKVNDGLYIANGFTDTDDTFIGIKNVGHVGRYAEEKRALEVLDEIQKIIKPSIITTNYECEIKDNSMDKLSFNLDMNPQKMEVIEMNTYVYQMPEE